ncbi:MAG: ATPase, T2SS/T4P/T4SS family [Acidiphilium sp.]|nr:ATPase, T2SS/T4P/T4SS family [Acidiphilium sp.]
MATSLNAELSRLVLTVPEALVNKVILADGVLHVASDYIMDSAVIDFEMKLMRLNLLSRKQSVSMADLDELRRTGQRAGPTREYDKHYEVQKIFALLDQAVQMSASDLHLVVHESHAEIRMRVDGYLDSYAEMTKDEAMNLIRAVYVAAGSSKNKNQFSFDRPIMARLSRHGEFRLPASLYAVRFASMRSDTGGIVVLRLLYDSLSLRGKNLDSIQLEDLGFTRDQAAVIRGMADEPNGIILIDGPTGSGKSTTLKFVMQWTHAHYPHFNIITVEDPPEYPIPGSTQIPVMVQEDSSDTIGGRSREYGAIIAGTLRLDPDILMVGEVRDGESAIAALRAAETGHRLWTTLHANDAWESLNRLADLLREGGMHEPMSILTNTQNLCGLIAQRLVPKLCMNCRKPLTECPDALPAEILDELMQAVPDIDLRKIYLRGDGCRECVAIAGGDARKQKADKRHGILGRTVVAEIVRPDQTILDIARKDGIPAARRFWLRSRGGKLIADAAVEKIMEGVLDPRVAREFIGPLVTGAQLLQKLDAA